MNDASRSSHPCALCGRRVPRVTRHHLVPKSRLRKKKRKAAQRKSARSELELVDLCPACHRAVHATLSEKELEQSHRTIESLREHPTIAKFIKWVRKQRPDRGIRTATTNDLREARRADRERRKNR